VTLTVDSDDLLRTALRILLVLVLAFTAVWLIQQLVTPVVRLAVREQMTQESPREVTKRIDTLSHVIYRTAVVLVTVIAVVTILPEFGLNAAPLIAGLGLVGLAVGFGAQNLVRDVINGLFILLENQYAVGDIVRLVALNTSSVSGTVEDMNLRRTVLRDREGVVHIMSHNQIATVSNLTRGYSRLNLLVTIPVEADLNHAFEVIEGVGESLIADPSFGPHLREAPRASGVERLGETSVDLRIVALTEPADLSDIEGELRRRLKQAFDAEGINTRTS
jgi:small conductance mechanosensitive channel